MSDNTITPPKKIRRAKSTSTKGHYLTNASLLEAVKEAKEKGRVTDKLAKMWMLLTERYAHKSTFVGYSFRDDMVSVALINLVANGLKFNAEKYNNPFAYYTTMIHHSFLQYLADEKKHRNIRDIIMVENGINPSSTFLENNHDGFVQAHPDYYPQTVTPTHYEE